MIKKQRNDKIKKSVVLSGLVSTAGLFLAKLLGLIYSIPLSSILGSDAYMSYYGTAYRIYSYILNVFTAGFPFAIATMVARYTVREDSRALRKIKVISHTVMMIIGILGMLVMFGLSWLLAGIIASGTGVHIMGNCLRILSLAIFFVPVLSCYRGFWEGRKEMQEYAFSQVFEQIFRVGFLLTCAYLVVYVFHMDRVYALYFAVLSTSVAAVAGILQIAWFDRKNYGEIEEAAEAQKTKTISKKKLFREFITLAIPYFISAILGYSDDIFNSILLPLGLRLHGYTSDEQDVILSAINYVGTKMTAIPMILSPGFVSALIPHISEAIAVNDTDKVKRTVVDCFNIILYIAIPISACIFLYAEDIFHILFYTSDPVTAAGCLRWISIEGLLSTIMPVMTSLMLALGLKKESLGNQTISVVLKGILMIPCIMAFGYAGVVISTLPGIIYLIVRDCYVMHREYRISFRRVISVAVKCVLCLLVMSAVCIGLKKIGLDGAVGGKLGALGRCAVNVIVSLGVYVAVSSVLHIPETVFHRSLASTLKARFRRTDSDQD